MNKQDLINAFLKTPIEKGQSIFIKGLNSRNPEQPTHATVKAVDDEFVYYSRYNGVEKIKKDEVIRDIAHVGIDPFQPELRGSRYNIDIWQLLFRSGWNEGNDNQWTPRIQVVDGIEIPEVCYEPTIIDANGKEVTYQRGFVWSLTQKQLLIDSIYNNIEIGKFVLRPRSWNWVEKRIKNGKVDKHTAFADIVDGKQRLNTLIEFVTGKFYDSYGNYWNDLSEQAQRKFKGYMQLSYVELAENSMDADVIKAFLAINHMGVPMSKEHIEYVKSIQI